MALKDIVTVKQFDKHNFQILSNNDTMHFFLQAESIAELTCWVQGLFDYTEKYREYDRCLRAYQVEHNEI